MNTYRDIYGQEWYEVTKLPIAKDLSELSALLHQQRVEHRIVEESGNQIVWVINSDLVPQLQQFIEQWKTGELQIVKTEHSESTESNSNSQNSDIKNSSVTSNFNFLSQIYASPVTAVMFFLCLAGWFIVSANLSFLDYSLFTFSDVGSLSTRFVESLDFPFSEPWRFITPIFLHFGLMHIVGNALFLWYLGSRLERVLGRFSYIMFIVFVGLISNAAQYVWESNGNFGGFSGVNYGFIGYILIRQSINPVQLLSVPTGLLWFSIITMVLGAFGVMDVIVGGSIANAAHVTGFLLGITFAFITHLSKIKSTS